MSIPVYRAEADADIAELVKAQSSIAYVSQLCTWEPPELDMEKVAASFDFENIKPSIDLYPTQSILVSTVKNKNDDVFTVAESWKARHTPVHKPTNIEHDEKQLVGHITHDWVMDDSGVLIADDSLVSDLPDLFHICNGAVIYLNYEDEDLKARAQLLVQEIQAGKKFVSMECLFSDFSYAVTDPDGKEYVVARNDESAFLTKHLRAYGGSGSYDGYSVARALMNIVFSGKGYVDKPANPDSIIFDDSSIFHSNTASEENPFISSPGVYLSYKQLKAVETDSNRSNLMSTEVNVDKGQVDRLEAQVASLVAANEASEKKLAEANITQYETRIQELEDAAVASDQALADKEDALTTAATELEAAKSDIETAKSELEAVAKEKADLEATLAKNEAEKIVADRVSTLVDGGIDKDEALAKVETFASLDDEQFVVLAEELVAAFNFKKKDDKDDKDKKDKKDKKDADASDDSSDDSSDASDDSDDDDNVATDAIDNAQANDDTAGTVGSEDETDTVANTRTAIAAALGFATEDKKGE